MLRRSGSWINSVFYQATRRPPRKLRNQATRCARERGGSKRLTPLAPDNLATSAKSNSTSTSQLPSSHCLSARTALREYKSDLTQCRACREAVRGRQLG